MTAVDKISLNIHFQVSSSESCLDIWICYFFFAKYLTLIMHVHLSDMQTVVPKSIPILNQTIWRGHSWVHFAHRL